MITDTGSRRAAVRQMAGNAAEARLARGERAAADGSDRLRNRALVALSGAVFLLLAHAFVPIDEFVHRGDDAYYYFKVAANYPRLGYWSFDGITPTNGVQPLWAAMLSGLALLLSWVGVTDLELLARFFVALAALLNYGASLLLFRLLAERVSIGTGIAVAGAFLFPLGITWSRVWGMENSLYALTLVGTICYFHLVFLARACWRTAVVLGILLALTALSRLNACLFIPCLLQHTSCQQFILLRCDQFIFGPRDSLQEIWKIMCRGCQIPVMGQPHLSCHLAQQKIPLRLVDQCEIWPQSHCTTIGPQNIGTEGMESTHLGHSQPLLSLRTPIQHRS